MQAQGFNGDDHQPNLLRNPNSVMIETALGLDKASEESIKI